jgi:hypothetical protein
MTMFRLKWVKAAADTFNELEVAALAAHKNRDSKKKKKSSRQEGLFKQVLKTIKLLEENPRHPGLRTHEYTSLRHPYEQNGKVFEAYAQNDTPGAYRIFWCYGPAREEITIIAITPHP